MTPKPLIATAAACTLGALIAAVPPAGAAQTSAESSTPATAQLGYQCSGIGVEERAAAESVPQTLRLIFAEPDGEYLGDVTTRVSSGGTELVNVTCAGPWLLLDLPDGRYKVSASFKDKTVSRVVTIHDGKRQKQIFVF